MSRGRREVVVLASYVAQYRAPFFERATQELAERGVTLTVAAGGVDPGQAARGDAVELPGAMVIPTRSLHVAGRELVVRRTGRLVEGADLIITEQSRRNLDTYQRLLGRRTTPVALWGHGRTTTRSVRGWEHLLLDRLTLRADWFFAYTERGRREMVHAGFPADRISVVQNATDTTALRTELSAVTTRQKASLRKELGTTAGRTALFLGALDPSKRLYFLLEAARRLASELPGFTLVIAGDGPLRTAVEQHAATEPWLRYVGPAFGTRRAQLAAVADVMLMPGRVGLSVVDSFAMGLPMVTTNWPGHAPEFEYLEPGVNGIVAPDMVAGFTAATKDLLTDRKLHALLVRGCQEAAQEYRIEAMVERFVAGVDGALSLTARQSVGWPPVRSGRAAPAGY